MVISIRSSPWPQGALKEEGEEETPPQIPEHASLILAHMVSTSPQYGGTSKGHNALGLNWNDTGSTVQTAWSRSLLDRLFNLLLHDWVTIRTVTLCTHVSGRISVDL